MLNIDFIRVKTIARYLIAFTIILLSGVLLKDIIAIIFALIILYYAATKNLYRSIEFLLLWFFVYNFFLGQGYITNELISKYAAKPYFLLFVIFIFFYKKIPKDILKKNYLKTWIIFLLICFLSAIFQSQSPFVIITISAFFLLYMLLQTNILNTNQYKNILNLLVSVAILQTVISFLQVSELISPPTRIMDDGSGGQFEWVAEIDDVASGTFGPSAAYIASWYAALISLLLFITWSITKKKSYLIITVITFLQFAITDSKTIMAVTIVMLIYMMFYIFKKKSIFKLNIGRYIIFILLIAFGAFGFYKAWDAYYVHYGEKTGGSRTDFSAVYNYEAKESRDLILANIQDWGKLRGFQYIFEDFKANDPRQLIWGYGIQGYTFNNKMGYIESKDTQIMQLNNLTKSRSGLISTFATTGLIGFLLFTFTFSLWYNINNQKEKNNYDLVKNGLLKIYLPFSILAAFLYSIDITCIPLISFAAIISIYTKMSDHLNQIQLVKK